jgi:hypothetical protein
VGPRKLKAGPRGKKRIGGKGLGKKKKNSARKPSRKVRRKPGAKSRGVKRPGGLRENKTNGRRVKGERRKKTDRVKKAHGERKRFSGKFISRYNSPRKFLKHRLRDPNYLRKHGKRFSWLHHGVRKFGWKLVGRYHRHWKFYCYNRYYRKWLFYDEGCGCYYYLCGRCNCFLPVSYSCPVCLDQPDDPNVAPCCEETEGPEEGDTPDEPDEE